jgi:predicted alpha/beta-hydrolase family hydrolase
MIKTRLLTILQATGLFLLANFPITYANAEMAYDFSRPAIEQSYSTVREATEGLPAHTLYRPQHLELFDQGSVPVVVWANGACRDSNYGFLFISTMVASHGFIIIANGAFDAPAITGGSVNPQNQIDAMNWLESEAGIAQLQGRADLTKIAVAGQSCGGLEALIAGADPRTKTVLAFNTGFFEDCTLGYCRDELANLHTPVLFVNGGPSDIAYENSIANYNLTQTPAYLAEHKYVGHSGFLYGIREGEGDTTVLTQAERTYVNWLDFMLNGNQEARGYFFGANCDLCGHDDWNIMSKGW